MFRMIRNEADDEAILDGKGQPTGVVQVSLAAKLTANSSMTGSPTVTKGAL
jgi:hypothetical protein